ncbi:substrate-binding domain-containing protein [Vibrio sp. DNB22_10_4]
MNKKVTASDVASYLGVSRSAVSRAFTEGASINDQKRTRILDAAKALGYQPNMFARTLSTPTVKAKSNLVAILISDFSNPFQSHLFEVLSSELQTSGKQPMLLNVKHENDLDEALMRLSGYQVDGVIAVMGSLPAESLNLCLKLSLPLVTLGRADKSGSIPSVQTDNHKAGQLAAEYLLSNRCQKLAFVSGRADGQASNERWKGFESEVIQQAGIQPFVLEGGRYGYSAGFEVGIREMESLRDVDGVFCASDALALGLLDACRQISRIEVPNQLYVVGCDDVPQAAWQGYQLTTVAQPVQEIAKQALLALENQWQSETRDIMVTRVQPYLKVRRT